MSSIPLRTRIENNVALWTLSMLLAGFIAGYGACREIVSLSGQQIVPSDKMTRLEETASTLKEQLAAALQANRAADAPPDKPADPGRISFESTTSGEHSPIVNTVNDKK